MSRGAGASALPAGGGKGLFTKDIEEALSQGRIDVAVHSLKDLPSELPPGLTVGAVTAREDPRDCLISRGRVPFDALPVGSVIGTSSFRRRVQLLQLRPDICIVELRGNLDTRIRKLNEGRCDALVVALAGVKRLHREPEIAGVFSLDEVLPAAGQGSLALEVRAGDAMVLPYVIPLDHSQSRVAALAERAFLKRLEGSCQVPLGAYASLASDPRRGPVLCLRGFLADLEGRQVLTGADQGPPDQPEHVGQRLADQLLARGAGHIIQSIRNTWA